MEGNEEGSLKMVQSFVIEFADIVLRASRQGCRRTASQLVQLQTNIPFETNILMRCMKTAKISSQEIRRSSGRPIDFIVS